MKSVVLPPPQEELSSTNDQVLPVVCKKNSRPHSKAEARIQSKGRELKNYTMTRSSSVLFIPALLAIFCAESAFLHKFYKRGARRDERDIKAAYAAKFEDRAWIARSLNENLTQAILRSKSIVNAMRSSPGDIPAMKKGFNQVAQWLDVAAKEGDIALRSLEKSSKER
jgi:hypothetical protein